MDYSKLYHIKGGLVDIYESSSFPGGQTRANRYSRTCLDQDVPTCGGPCSVEEAGLGVYKIISFTMAPPQITHPENFLEVLSKWGCEWMWGNMQVTGDNGWLSTVIQENTLVAVTDGSYMQELYPNMNSCALSWNIHRDAAASRERSQSKRSRPAPIERNSLD